MKHEIYFSHPKASDDISKTIPVMIEVQTDAKAFESITKIINAQNYGDNMTVKSKYTIIGDWHFVYVEDILRLTIFDHRVYELRSVMNSEHDNLVNKNAELEGKLIRYAGEIEELKTENSNLRKELKSALESLHDQYDDSDKPCCKNCVHCRPFVGSTNCYCSQTGELIKKERVETYYCKDMVPYEDDYPF